MGDAGNDELYGDEGADLMDGGTGHDLLHGGEDDDTVDGGDGNDLLYGAEGDDILTGGDGDDYLLGGFGSDEMSGGTGNDTLDGSFSNGTGAFGPLDQDAGDTLSGGEGDDHLFLGRGDIGTGGEGADIFESGSFIGEGGDAAVVTDFNPAEDRIQLSVDLEASPNPEVEVVDFADGTGADILVDGTVVLSISGAQGLDPNAILIRDIRLDDLAQSA
jgi:Ca2+-binding RTX toxin-like protein